MDRGDQGPPETLHEQQAVPKGLHVVEDLETLPGTDPLQDPQGPEAEDEHLREKAEAGDRQIQKNSEAERFSRDPMEEENFCARPRG